MKAIPKRWYSWGYTIEDGARTVADIDVAMCSGRAAFKIEGSVYVAYREGVLRGAYILEQRGSTVARAEKTSAFRREFLVEHADQHYTLRPRSALGRSFLLMNGARQVGSIIVEGLFSRRVAMDLPAELPLPVKVFVLWLVILTWRRAAAAAGCC
ncbi:MAG: hypothetical protein ACYST0_13045 [Planctomycetota bacterium]|jgi:hypothetical protein